MKPLLRDIQSRFPYLTDFKFKAASKVRKTFKIPFEPEYALFEHFPPKGGHCIVDAGANRGQSIEAFRLYWPDAKVCSFEPNPVLFDHLQRRFEGEGNLVLHNYGLGKERLRRGRRRL